MRPATRTTWTKETAPKGGRPKGTPNKVPGEVREMVLAALERVGGTDYLVERALDPKTMIPFLSLVGCTVRRDVNLSGTLKLEEIVDDLTAVVRARREAAAKAMSGTSS